MPTITADPAATPFIQTFGKRQVLIVKKADGARAAKILDRGRISYVPVEILNIVVGKDKWMRNILVRCAECKVRVKAGEMECEMCVSCYEKAGEENAKLDGR